MIYLNLLICLLMSYMIIWNLHWTWWSDNAELYCKLGVPFVMGTTGGDRERLYKTVKDSNNYAVISPQMGKQVSNHLLVVLVSYEIIFISSQLIQFRFRLSLFLQQWNIWPHNFLEPSQGIAYRYIVSNKIPQMFGE